MSSDNSIPAVASNAVQQNLGNSQVRVAKQKEKAEEEVAKTVIEGIKKSNKEGVGGSVDVEV